MALELWQSALIGLIISFLLFVGILVLWWYILKIVTPIILNTNTYDDFMVRTQFMLFWQFLLRGIPGVIYAAINSGTQAIITFTNNIAPIAGLIILSSGSLIWLEYQDKILDEYIVVRQCYLRQGIDFFLLPVFDICVMFYDSVIPVVNFYINMQAAVWYLPFILLFKCAANQDIGNILVYFTNVFFASFNDWTTFVQSNIFTAEWNIIASLQAFANFFDTLPPIFTCFCSVLSPAYQALDLWVHLDSVIHLTNCFWNFIIRSLQLVIATLFFFLTFILPGPNTTKPNFTNITLAACCTLVNLGDAIEDTTFILAELLWSLLSTPSLPSDLEILLSTHYMSVLTHPLCGIVKTFNMTVVLMLNLNDDQNGFLNPDGTGIQYLQFGFVMDEFKVAAQALGSLFYVFNAPAQALATQLGLSVVDIIAFSLEWVIGNVWYFTWNRDSDVLPTYPAPDTSGLKRDVNFLLYYFPNYWLKSPPAGTPVTLGSYTYSSSLSQLYNDLFIAAVAAGNLVGLINNALGCITEHSIKVLVTIGAVIANLISFFFTILTIQPDLATSARGINFDPFFQELFYLSGCLGDVVSQFGNCTVTDNAGQENLFCCTGNLITEALDTFILLSQQIVHFAQDMLTLPTSQIDLCLFGAFNPSNTTCVRIPMLAPSIYQLSLALCSFSCAIANVIPVTSLFDGFNCIFGPASTPPPTVEPGENIPLLPRVQCGSVTSCIGNVICGILQIFTVPLSILNEFFVKMIQGNPFANLFDFLNFSGTLIATAIGNAGDGIGILVDCCICAIFTSGTNCQQTFYVLFHYTIVVPLVALAGSFGLIAFTVTKFTLGFLKDMNIGLGPIALYTYVRNMLLIIFDLFWESFNFFFNRLMTSLGLPLIGSFFSSVSRGGCIVLETTLNVLITEVQIVSLGLATTPQLVLCCFEGVFCFPGKKRFEDDIDTPNMTPYDDNIIINKTTSSLYGNSYLYKTWDYDNEEKDIVLKNPNNPYNNRNHYKYPIYNKSLHETEYKNKNTVVLNLTDSTWLKTFIESMPDNLLQWPKESQCNKTMIDFQSKKWVSFTQDERWHFFFCIYKIIWKIRTDNQREDIPPSHCSLLMEGYKDNDWKDLRYSEKSEIFTCVTDRIYIDKFRHNTGWQWFPQDWFTNPSRKFYFIMDLLSNTKVYMQYIFDQTTSPTIILTPAYQATWSSLGLDTTPYNNLNTEIDVERMRDQYRLLDYYKNNMAEQQYNATVTLTTGFWKLIKNIGYKVQSMAESFSDNITDPRVYLTKEYTGRNQQSVSTSSFYWFVSRILNYLNEFSSKFSDRENLRKRTETIQKTLETGVDKLVKAANKEFNLMQVEWMTALRHKADVVYGECENKNETIEFLYEYEKSIHGVDKYNGEHSIIYKLSEWWNTFEFPKVQDKSRLKVPRDGKYREDALLYHPDTQEIIKNPFHTLDNNGKKETLKERLVRYYNTITKGTPESRRRVDKLTSPYRIIRDTFFMEIFKQRMKELERKYDDNQYHSKVNIESNHEEQQQQENNTKDPMKTIIRYTYTDSSSSSNIVINNVSQQIEDMKNNIVDSYDELCQSYPYLDQCYKTEEKELLIQYDGDNKNKTIVNNTTKDTEKYYLLQQYTRNKDEKENADDEKEEEEYMKYDRYKGLYDSNSEYKSYKMKLDYINDEYSYLTNHFNVPESSTIDKSISIFNLEHSEIPIRDFDSNVIKGPEHISNRLKDSSYRKKGLIKIQGLIDIQCTSNISFLCAECLVLDNLVGRLLNGIRILSLYYIGGQYSIAINKTMFYLNYHLDQNAQVLVGDSPELPVLWPWLSYDNLRIIGDDTANKLRFSDIANRTQQIIANNSIANSTLYNYDLSTVNGIVTYFILSWFLPVITWFYNAVAFIFSPTGIGTASDSATFFVENWVVCDWNVGNNYLCTNKRFSIGETAFAYFVIFFLVMLISFLVLHIDTWAIVTGTTLSFWIFMFTYLNVTYNWAWLCYPGLPVLLMDDINYVFINTLFTKCDWFTSGLIKEEYNNNNCYLIACDNTPTFTYNNCQNFGFKDIFSNIIFFLQVYAPWILQWLRDTTTPLYIIYQIPWVNERWNAFVNIDLTTEKPYALYYSCGTWATVPFNLIIASTFLTGLSIIYPLSAVAIEVGFLLINILISLLFLMYYILESIFMMVQMYPYELAGLIQVPMAGSDGNYSLWNTNDGGNTNGANYTTYSSSPSSSTSQTQQYDQNIINIGLQHNDNNEFRKIRPKKTHTYFEEKVKLNSKMNNRDKAFIQYENNDQSIVQNAQNIYNRLKRQYTKRYDKNA